MGSVPSDEAGEQRVRAAEVVASLCLATDLGMGFPWEHGLDATASAMRLCDLLDVDGDTRRATLYVSLLVYSGCTTDTVDALRIFGGSATEHSVPHIWGSKSEHVRGVLRAIPDPGAGALRALSQLGTRLPHAIAGNRGHQRAICEVAEVLADRLGLPPSISGIFFHLTERWDGAGMLGRSSGEAVPLALRVSLLARDAAYLSVVGGVDHAVTAIRRRAGHAHDPAVARTFLRHARDVLEPGSAESSWGAVLAAEPAPHLVLGPEQVNRALAAMGDFTDLMSPSLSGHSSGVSDLAGRAAEHLGMATTDVQAIRRAGMIQDIGRVAVHPAVWEKPEALTPDEREQVRLHAYHSERILAPSPFLGSLATLGGCHHERLDGSGYHRGLPAPALSPSARLLAAADVFRAITQPRPHRPARPGPAAAQLLTEEARQGRLDGEAVAAVLHAAGEYEGPVSRPSGLTPRETQVVGLLARGLATKQVARSLGISPKTADHHIQHAYRKIGVSSRAAVTLFAMEHGLVAWGELPIGSRESRP